MGGKGKGLLGQKTQGYCFPHFMSLNSAIAQCCCSRQDAIRHLTRDALYDAHLLHSLPVWLGLNTLCCRVSLCNQWQGLNTQIILSEVSTSVMRGLVQIAADSATPPSYSSLASCHLSAGLEALSVCAYPNVR